MSSGRSTTISIATSTDYVDTADQESRKVLEERRQRDAISPSGKRRNHPSYCSTPNAGDTVFLLREWRGSKAHEEVAALDITAGERDASWTFVLEL